MVHSPSEVRAQIVAEHERLRALIRVVAAARDVDTLRSAASALFAALRAHIDDETALIVPVLRTIDAWGPERVARLHAEHDAQRAWIDDVERSIEGAELGFQDLGWRLSAFALRLREDMTAEETVSFNEELFSGLPPVDLGRDCD